MKDLFLTNRFFIGLAIVSIVFALSFIIPILFPFAQMLLSMLLIVCIIDAFLLFSKKVDVKTTRILPKILSLGDENEVKLILENLCGMSLKVKIIEELPIQFQWRNFEINTRLIGNENKTMLYHLRPTSRGMYHFGKTFLFLRSPIGIIERRIKKNINNTIAVYPSIIQMKKFELEAFKQTMVNTNGIKKMRRIGHSYEFEQIKEYVRGDDYRSINWKATGRSNNLMVNQYEDERSQQIYSIIDKGRSMKLPFNQLSLLDHAINTSLVISNIALKKEDKAGLLTFSDMIGGSIKAEKGPKQLNKILRTLYHERERHLEPDYELLYRAVRNLINGRSLVLLFTNFESNHSLERALPILRRIGKLHLLVVIFFENTEISDFARQPAETLSEIFTQSVAQRFTYEKKQMVQTLRHHGIQAICTRPEELSLHTVNKYLELKARGLI